MSSVRFENLNKRFGEKVVVEDFSLDVEDGEFIVLLGPSGCGKTTTLRMLAGLESPTNGQIYIGDREVTDVPSRQRDVAMVFQSYALYPHKTVAENMSFALRLAKMPKDEIETRVKSVAKTLGLDSMLDARPRTLSGGQRQRVALGRAMIRDPAVFLFDEPLSNLDAKLRSTMRSELIQMHNELKATMIYVTHDQMEAMTMADRIVIMNGGIAQQIGTPLDVYDDPANQFVAQFIGSPGINVVPIHKTDADGAITMGKLKLPLPKDHPGASIQSACIGMRPEHLSLAKKPKAIEIKGTVDAVEQLGAETIFEVETAGPRLVVRAPRASDLKPGVPIALYLNPDEILAFDADGNRVRVA
ncbi:ABC transporter ATP-binding protein [Methyloligella sp. 2.7D]|uniref:ABC transporter ATP-binding protein n=1 Tax=unclassified Methyloligella TaxID=2625955 RepID=UPI00157CAF0F|nr:ABC transporter ATP-binding protein [Methyloligella sp. GL2]QKP75990.1 ABC transporter ATP-binding protein [Methyloligella sp. GL2]